MKTRLVLVLLFNLVICSCIQKDKEITSVGSNLKTHNTGYYYRNYHCFDFVKRCELEILKIKNLDTLIYVTSSEFHGEYEEVHGKLSRINDSIYFVKVFKHLTQRGNDEKPFDVAKDSIFFYCDSSLVNSDLSIEYLNGQREPHKIYSTQNRFWINEKLFNKENDRLYLILDHQNPVVNERVEIASKYADPKFCVGFTSRREVGDFYIVVNDKQVMTLNVGSEGHQSLGLIFKLDRMEEGVRLPKNRELYD